jgi:hypothetical protein
MVACGNSLVKNASILTDPERRTDEKGAAYNIFYFYLITSV